MRIIEKAIARCIKWTKQNPYAAGAADFFLAKDTSPV
jgi:hypothetical protein